MAMPPSRAPIRGDAVRIVALPDTRLVVSSDSDHSLSLLRPDTLTEERHVALPAGAPGLPPAPDGRRLYLGLDDDSLLIPDTTHWRIDGHFATGAGPDAAIVLAG